MVRDEAALQRDVVQVVTEGIPVCEGDMQRQQEQL